MRCDPDKHEIPYMDRTGFFGCHRCGTPANIFQPTELYHVGFRQQPNIDSRHIHEKNEKDPPEPVDDSESAGQEGHDRRPGGPRDDLS